MVRLLKKFFYIIFFTKKVFKKPLKSKFLIFDEIGSELIQKYLPREQTSILQCRDESINLYVLIFCILKGKISRIDYFNEYIRYVNPKVIISTIDNNPAFYKLFKREDQFKILVASTIRTPVHDSSLFKLTKNGDIKYDKKTVDIVFTLNSDIGEKFKKFNVKQVISIGSFKSNHYQLIKKKNIELLYISSWANLPLDHQVTEDVNFKEFDSHQESLIKNLSKFGNKKNIKITVLGKIKILRSDIDKEYNYYNSILKNNHWEFLKGSEVNSYHIVDRSNISITLNSTLGYESFSRGNKTIFFDLRSYKKSLESLKFAWPNVNIRDNGVFWTTGSSYQTLENIISEVNNINIRDWTELSKHYKNILPRDEGNLIFKDKINSLFNL